MSTLSITLTAETEFTIQPAETVKLNGSISILSILDTPEHKTVEVDVDNVGTILLEDLSDTNYGDWTSSQVTAATTYTTVPAETVTLNGNVIITNISDNPGEKTVEADVDGVGTLLLEDLSNDNYGDWSRAEVVASVKKIIEG